MKTGNRKSTRKRPSPPDREEKQGTVSDGGKIYCTECGATLENFCFSENAEDLGAIRKTLAQCRKQGRFTGEFCSKLFIAHPEAAEGPAEEDDD
jgi:hypothetical protein